MLNRPAYSYLNDRDVPAFQGGNALAVMDAHCGLCARGARWISHNDRAQQFNIIPVQSALGQALLRHYGLDPADPSTWLYIDSGVGYTSLDAAIRAGRRLGGIWRLLGVLRILPRNVQDALYGG